MMNDDIKVKTKQIEEKNNIKFNIISDKGFKFPILFKYKYCLSTTQMISNKYEGVTIAYTYGVIK